MPRSKSEGWGSVTLTISDEVSRALRILSAMSGEEMGKVADRAMRKGDLLENLQRALVRETSPVAPLSAKGRSASSAMAATTPEPKPKKRKLKETGDPELFKFLESLRLRGDDKLIVAQFMKAVAPGIRTENYNVSWKKAGHVPRAYVQAVRDYLTEHGFEGVPPAPEKTAGIGAAEVEAPSRPVHRFR